MGRLSGRRFEGGVRQGQPERPRQVSAILTTAAAQTDSLFLIQISHGLFQWTGEALLPKINLGAQFHALLALSLGWCSCSPDLGFDIAAVTEFPRTW